MNFTIFPVASTNIFPISNSKNGGQLVTEWNLRSRESVCTPENVRYHIGPSYAHGEEDFKVDYYGGGKGTALSISAGRAVVNGHYVEALTPMVIDLVQANAELKNRQQAPLKGKLAIGIRVFYSTEATMAGSLLIENADHMYEGVQLVILPEEEFKLPQDVPGEGQAGQVTAHLKLATFNYINGSISSLTNNYPGKCQSISATRISNVDQILSSGYVKKTGLNSRKLYTYSTKLDDPDNGVDTWCDSTDSLMIWDTQNPPHSTAAPRYNVATFALSADSRHIDLVIPHKQVDGMKTPEGVREYYQPRTLQIPAADYSTNTPGTVTPDYTQRIKSIEEKVRNQKYLPWGKQKHFIDILNDVSELPPISSNWDNGDYVFVRQDNTFGYQTSLSQAPASLYVVLPGLVRDIAYASQIEVPIGESLTIPTDSTELGRVVSDIQINGQDSSTWPVFFTGVDNVRGNSEDLSKGIAPDYFVATWTNDAGTTTYYFFVVASTGPKEYSSPVQMTGELPLAQNNIIGGFYNVAETELDQGYIIRDENGHLRLLDYSLLRSGALAYQLSESFTAPSGISTEDVQSYLDEYVNQRVAFPDYTVRQDSSVPNVIDITLELPEESDASVLNIYDIDSRFNTAIYLHITGSANNNTIINISDCQKIRIDNNIGGNPVINLYRSGLYYDASILNYLNTIEDMSLWYEKYSEDDPSIVVDNMTVRELYTPILAQHDDFWTNSVENDNHYMYALQSLTFGADGAVIGVGIYIKNDTTANIQLGHSVLSAQFVLPQGSGLIYPQSRMSYAIKITGTFVTAYRVDEPAGYIVIDTNFTALTKPYDAYAQTKEITGSIAFHANSSLVTHVIEEVDPGVDVYGWVSGSYHIFNGGVIQ